MLRLHKGEQCLRKLREISFFRVSLVPEQCTENFKMSDAWMNMWNKMTKDKSGGQEAEFHERVLKEAAWRGPGVFEVLHSTAGTARPFLKPTSPTRTIRSHLSSRLTVPKLTSRNPRHPDAVLWLLLCYHFHCYYHYLNGAWSGPGQRTHCLHEVWR